MHQSIRPEIVQAVLGLHAADPEGTGEVVGSTAAVRLRKETELRISRRGIALAAPVRARDPQQVAHHVSLRPTKKTREKSDDEEGGRGDFSNRSRNDRFRYCVRSKRPFYAISVKLMR